MRVLVTGAGGMLAQALVPELRRRGHEVHAPARAELDITREDAVGDAFASARPEVVVQCAAYTAVDDAESNYQEALRVNAVATEIVARACHQTGALLVYPSTDYVFPGSASRPYRPDDPIEPVNAYGRSKAAGEEAAREAERWLVVRTSWLYGAGGRHFVDTISRLARERGAVDVVDDQVGRPTWTGTLAGVLADLAERGATGTHHATDGGEPVSWHGFAREILRQQEIRAEVRPVSSSAFARPAPRPAYSVLDCASTEAALHRSLPDWRHALTAHLRAGQ